jgi:hypothetical protein
MAGTQWLLSNGDATARLLINTSKVFAVRNQEFSIINRGTTTCSEKIQSDL